MTECKNYYQKLYNKQKTCQAAQKELLQNTKPKISNTQNQKLKKQIEISISRQNPNSIPSKNNTKNMESNNNYLNFKPKRKIRIPKILETYLIIMHRL